jgi:CelD/BcsL family acetyltransferase involved in cellulose biosynthesis
MLVAAAPNPPDVTVRVLRDATAWDALRDQWEGLFAVSPNVSAALRFDWMREWWRVYGPAYERPGGGLAIVTLWRGDQLVGLLPLYESAGRRGPKLLSEVSLRFISTGEAEFEETLPCYLDLLHRPGEEDACLSAVFRVLADRSQFRWDVFDLVDVPDGSALLRVAQSGPPDCRVSVVDGISPIAEIGDGFEAYLRRLSPNGRQQGRRTLRKFHEMGGVFELARDEAEADVFFEQMVRLHQSRWTRAGKQGCFAAPRFTEFVRTLARRWVPDGRAVLARLSVGGEPLTIVYGFIVRARFEFYQSGIRLDEASPLKNPGIAAHLLLMEHLSSGGIAEYDFLAGDAHYKQRMATGSRGLKRLRLSQPSLRMAALEASRFVRRASRKGLRVVLGRCGWLGPRTGFGSGSDRGDAPNPRPM